MADDSVSTNQATVISSNAQANANTSKVTITSANAVVKIVKNLEIVKFLYTNRPNTTKGFWTDITGTLNMMRTDSSRYQSFDILMNLIKHP